MASAIDEEKITITYFQFTARGQFVTAILDIIGRKYELNSISSEKWATEKQNTPFGVLPVLDVDGKKIGGTVTIARFVAERYGKGKLDQETDPFISAYYEGQADIANEILVKLYTYSFATDEVKDEKCKAFVSYAKDKLSFLEKSIKPGGLFQGNGGMLTWSEIVISSLLRDVRRIYPNYEELLKEFPNLNTLCANICRLLPKK